MHDSRLQDSGLAAYRWGTLFLEASNLAPITGKTFVNTLAAASAGCFPPMDGPALRATIALVHELVHLQQDIATGLGAWDHLTTREAYPRIVVQTRWLVSRNSDAPLPSAAAATLDSLYGQIGDEVRADLHAIREGTVALRQLDGATWVTDAAKNLIADGARAELPDRVLSGFSLRALLECEAACRVHGFIESQKCEATTLEQLERHRSLWHVVHMGEPYFDPISTLATAIENGPPDPRRVAEALPLYRLFATWAVGLVSSYPSPTMLAEWRGDPTRFNPVVRFILLCRTINELDASRAMELFVAVVSHDWEGAEHILADATVDPLPSTRRIYEHWLEELEVLASGPTWDAPLFRLRANAIRTRLDMPSADSLSAMLAARIPVQVLVEGAGIQGILQGVDAFEGDDLKRALLGRAMDAELVAMLHMTGQFHCPLGRAAICEARNVMCTSGITSFSLFPALERCKVRAQLERLGYFI